LYTYFPKFLKNLIYKVTGFSPEEFEGIKPVFRIPPDNDDSGLNLVLGSFFRKN
jgi:hypothetical protein